MPKNFNAIPSYSKEVPLLTTEQMIEVDRLMMFEYNIELIQMMENAGRCLAILAKNRFLGDFDKKKRVCVLAGTGGNGGGALVCARRLAAWGFQVEVYITDPGNMTPIPGHQLEILERMNIPVFPGQDLKPGGKADLIVDGVIGYSLSGDPMGVAKDMIEWANDHEAQVLSLDTPSGIDLTTGTVHHPRVKAAATLTLALPKVGLYHDAVKPLRGELYLGDISVPPQLYGEPSLNLNVEVIFSESDVVRLD